jgi:predicted hotdog family 3-hydroxylacyl-ACP dehydratase
MMLYQFEDEEQTVELLNGAFKIFIEYMSEAKTLYQGVLDAQDEQRSYLMGMLGDDKND